MKTPQYPGVLSPDERLAEPPLVSYFSHRSLFVFYLIVRYGGIEAALQQLRYGVEPAAIRKQMRSFENELGFPLFEPGTFKPLLGSHALYEHARAFYEALQFVIEQTRAEIQGPTLRFGASEVVIQTYLLPLIQQLHAIAPTLRYDFRVESVGEIVTGVRRGEFDVGATPVHAMPSGFKSLRLASLKLALLVAESDQTFSPACLERPGVIESPLVCQRATKAPTMVFQEALAKRRIHWTPTSFIYTLGMGSWHTARGLGPSLALDLPILTQKPGVRALPIETFPRVEIMAFWKPRPQAHVESFLEFLKDGFER